MSRSVSTLTATSLFRVARQWTPTSEAGTDVSKKHVATSWYLSASLRGAATDDDDDNNVILTAVRTSNLITTPDFEAPVHK
jgi:hypothetical protein